MIEFLKSLTLNQALGGIVLAIIGGLYTLLRIRTKELDHKNLQLQLRDYKDQLEEITQKIQVQDQKTEEARKAYEDSLFPPTK